MERTIYNAGPFTTNIPFMEFLNLEYTCAAGLFSTLSTKVENNLPVVPIYVSRKINVESFTVSKDSQWVKVVYSLRFSVMEDCLFDDIKKIVEENGCTINSCEFSSNISGPIVKLTLSSEPPAHYDFKFINTQKNILCDLRSFLGTIHYGLKTDYDLACF